MAAKKTKFEGVINLPKGSTYSFERERALKLEVYATVKKFGSKKKILEDSLDLFFKKHNISEDLWNAGLLILKEGGTDD